MIDTTISSIKTIATPFAFMVLGGDLKFKSIFKNIRFSMISVIGKILVIPAIMLPVSYFLGFNQLEMAILLAVFATPNAVSSYAMARSYEADHELAGEIITIGTLFSISSGARVRIKASMPSHGKLSSNIFIESVRVFIRYGVMH